MAEEPDKDSKTILTVLCLIFVGAGIYGLNTGDLGWAGIIIGGIGLAILHGGKK